MATFKTTKTLLLLATVGMLTGGASAGALAQGIQVGNAGVRALEAPTDVTAPQLRAQDPHQGQAPFAVFAPAARYLIHSASK